MVKRSQSPGPAAAPSVTPFQVMSRVSPQYRSASAVWFTPGLLLFSLFCRRQAKKRNGRCILSNRGNVECQCGFCFLAFLKSVIRKYVFLFVFFPEKNSEEAPEGTTDHERACKNSFMLLPHCRSAARPLCSGSHSPTRVILDGTESYSEAFVWRSKPVQGVS